MKTALDTNILIDFLAGNTFQIQILKAALQNAGREGPLLLPVTCYAEIAGRFRSHAELGEFLDAIPLTILPLTTEAAFLAGHFFREYRLRGGSRNRILADFLVSAQAQIHADRLLTNDTRFYGTSFPNLVAVSPSDLTLAFTPPPSP